MGWIRSLVGRVRAYFTRDRLVSIGKAVGKAIGIMACWEALTVLVPLHTTVTVVTTLALVLLMIVLIWGAPQAHPQTLEVSV